jgi:hypothetical protein
MTKPARTTAAIALTWGLVAAVAGYAVLRALQHLAFSEPNPATLVWSAHAGFFWRAWTAGYAGGMAAFIVFVGVTPGRAAKHLASGVVVAAGLLAVQALLFP